jgi:ubiquitin thioesterase CYLD
MAMFPFTNVFDYLLYRKKEANDIKQYEQIQEMLKTEIVEPLRRYKYIHFNNKSKLL